MKLISKSSKNIKTLSDTAKTLIENAEGFSPTWYDDTTDNLTIGYGFKMGGMAQKYGLEVYKDKLMTEQDADIILIKIINEIIAVLQTQLLFFKNLTINQAAVLIDMSYNLGIGQFYLFYTFLSYMEENRIDNAVADLTTTLWYNQVKNRAIRDCFNLYAKPDNLYLI